MHTINLGDDNDGYLTSVFGYMYASDKQLPDGKIFRTWHGLRMWYITGMQHDGYLKADTLEEIKAVGKHKWNYVPHLDHTLKLVLDINLRAKPFHRVALRTCVDNIEWTSGKEFQYWKRLVLEFIDEYKTELTDIAK